MSSIFGKDRHFMSDLELEEAAQASRLPGKTGPANPHRGYGDRAPPEAPTPMNPPRKPSRDPDEMEMEPREPPRQNGNPRRRDDPSPVPSDQTDGSWNSTAGLLGAPHIPRPGTYTNQKSAPEGRTYPPEERSPSPVNTYPSQPTMSLNPNERVPYPSKPRPIPTTDRRSYREPETLRENFDTLPYDRDYPKAVDDDDDDDRRTQISMATSVMSTIPLSTQPTATKTMSGLYAMILIMMGVVVTSGDLVSRLEILPMYSDYFSMFVFGLGIVACLYMCMAAIHAKRRSGAPIDHHNGSIYIRIGAAVFCLGALTHCGIMIAEIFQYEDDCSYLFVTRLVAYCLRAAFVLTQLFLVAIFSKVCIQTWNGLARLLLAHIVAADFYLWFKLTLKETQESIIINVPNQYHGINIYCQRDYANTFTDIYEESTPILVPMAVSFCIISGCTLFTMWVNVGKDYAIEHREESCEEHEKQLTFQCREGVAGVMGGLFSVLASIVILVLYILFSNDRTIYDWLVTIYQAYNFGWLCILILLLPIATGSLKRHKKQDHLHNSLSQPILIVTTGGCVAYCILNIMSGFVLLVTRAQPRSQFNDIQRYSVFVAIATVCSYSVQAVEAAFQTVYLLDGLRRCPRKRGKRPSKSFVVFFLLVNVSLWITIIFELKDTELNPLQEDFYGDINWQIMLHFIGPIASLYRFHSVCCFLDVWKFAY